MTLPWAELPVVIAMLRTTAKQHLARTLMVVVALAGSLNPSHAAAANSGSIVEFPLGGRASYAALGSDGNVWLTENTANKIARITPAGTVVEFTIPTASSGVEQLT